MSNNENKNTEDIKNSATESGYADKVNFGYGHWISVEDGLPNYIEGEHHSENVFTTDGTNVYVMVRCYEEGGWLWGNCFGDIDGDAEIDDEYEDITHWMPLPKLVIKTV